MIGKWRLLAAACAVGAVLSHAPAMAAGDAGGVDLTHEEYGIAPFGE